MHRSVNAFLPVLLVFLFCFLSAGFTSGSYGLHWDSTLFLREALHFSEWFRSLVDPDPSVPPLSDVEHYFGRVHVQPPVYRMLTGLSIALFEPWLGAVESARLISISAYALTAAGLFTLIRRRHGWDTALVAAGVFATFPRVFTFAHLNALDMLMLFVYFVVFLTFPRCLRGRFGFLRLTLVYAGAFLTKVQGIWIPIAHGLWILLETVLSWRRPERGGFPTRRAVFLLLVATPMAGAIFLLLWPYMIHNRFQGLREYIEYVFTHGQLNVLYFGRIYQKPEFAPWHYVLVMPAITIPLTSLVLILAGLGVFVWNQAGKRTRGGEIDAETSGFAPGAMERLWFLGAMVHLGVMTLPTVPRHDGTRHLMMAYPFLAIFAALGYRAMIGWIRRITSGSSPSAFGWIRIIVLLAVLGIPLFENLKIHPYQGIYYNGIVGGPAGAIRRGFDGDYLGIYAQKAWPELNHWLPARSVLFLAAANPGNHIGPAAADLRKHFTDRTLREDIRVLVAQWEDHLLSTAGRRVMVLGGRLASYGSRERGYADNQTPVFLLERFGVPLLRVYSIPDSEEARTIPKEGIAEQAGARLLALRTIDGGAHYRTWWYCVRPVPMPLAFACSPTEKRADPAFLQVQHHLVPDFETPFWSPGDLFGADYSLSPSIPPENLSFSIVPHGTPFGDLRWIELPR